MVVRQILGRIARPSPEVIYEWPAVNKQRGEGMAKHAIFELSMPNRGSWNGGWSGASDKYVKSRELPLKGNDNVKDGAYHYYNFGDGWGAGITVRIVDGAKAKNAEIKGSKGFCGYDWMIDSIMKNGKIVYEKAA